MSECKTDFQEKHNLLNRSFARRKGKALSKSKKELLDNELPCYKFSIAKLEEYQDSYDKIYMEIGFGMGEHFVDLLARKPKSLFIGIEVYLNGVANLLKMAKEISVSNFLLWPDDLDLVLSELPDNLLNGIYILFPDPWPKKRYHKRRIINQARLDILKQKLKSGAFINFASDIAEYFTEVKNLFMQDRELIVSSDDFSKAYDKDYKATKYHQKALSEGREVQFLNADLG